MFSFGTKENKFGKHTQYLVKVLQIVSPNRFPELSHTLRSMLLQHKENTEILFVVSLRGNGWVFYPFLSQKKTRTPVK